MMKNFQIKDLLTDWQSWKLTTISTRFLIIKKVELVAHKLSYGVREW